MMINTPPIKLHFSWQLLCIALVVSEPAAALTLGELTIHSAVGQRFRGSVSYQLSPEDGLAEDCSKLSIVAPNNDLPGLGQASLRLQGRERGGQILIHSADAVYEPMASFSIKMECKGQQLQRSYTVFLDPAPLNPPNVTEETPPSIKPSTTAPRSHAHRVANPSKPKIQTTTPIRSEQTAVAANKSAETFSLAATGGQLRIESELNIKNQAPTVLSPEELKTKIAMMQSLQEQLQSEMTHLQQSMRHLQMLSGGQLNASSISPAPVATLNISKTETPIPSSAPTPTAAAIQRHQVEDEPKNSWWMAAVIALLAAGAGVGLWLRRRQNQNTWDADAESAISQLSRIQHKPSQQTDAQGEHSLFRHSQLFYGGIEVQEEDGSATLERAQLLVAQGETDQAIELLYHTIEENEADNEPWLLLFRVLRQQGMKTEYAQLARRFHDLDGDADDWALVRNIGYRLDPENPLYSAHNEEVASATTDDATSKDIEDVAEIIVIEHDLGLTSPDTDAKPAEVHIEPEPLREQDAILMDFLSTPSDANSETIPEKKSSVPQVISLDLPPLDFAPPEDENSPLDMALLSNPDESNQEVETIEASAPNEDEEPLEASSLSEDEEPLEEIDLVELEIELQPPLSAFDLRKH
jgi:pilus assembly protein FimV